MSKVTVIIPCFQAGNYLDESVDSALRQVGIGGRPPVIVVDDRSTDGATLAALERVRQLEGVVVLDNPGPKGSAAARNEGVRHATTEWIAFLDADDLWPENSLELRFDALTTFPDASWIGGDFLEINRDGTREVRGRFERNLSNYDFLEPAYASGKRIIRLEKPVEIFLRQPPTNTIISLLRKQAFESVGGYDESLLRQQDYHFFLRLAQRIDFHYVPEIVASYRLHANNSTRSLSLTQEWRVRALEALYRRPEFAYVGPLLREQIFGLHIANSYAFRAEQEFGKAARSALRAIAERPASLTAWKAMIAACVRRA